jgi:hypothetical protein
MAGQVTADIFKVGRVLIEMLTGMKPNDPKALPAVTQELKPILTKATDTDPQRKTGRMNGSAMPSRRRRVFGPG